jgi:hypothetical protein
MKRRTTAWMTAALRCLMRARARAIRRPIHILIRKKEYIFLVDDICTFLLNIR